MVSSRRVERPKLRAFLLIALVVSALFAGWTWLRPYEWSPDPGARCKVVGTQVRRDFKNFWVDVHLKVNAGQTHDLMKPVRLVTGSGREIEPADTTLGGDAKSGTTDLWFKFWLEIPDMEQALTLKLNDGALTIRKSTGIPRLGASNTEFFTTCRW